MTNPITLKEQIREEFLNEFKCIDTSCNQKGCIPHQVGEDEWEAQQCEFCFVVRFPAADRLVQSIDRTALMVLQMVEEKADGLKYDDPTTFPSKEARATAISVNAVIDEFLARISALKDSFSGEAV